MKQKIIKKGILLFSQKDTVVFAKGYCCFRKPFCKILTDRELNYAKNLNNV
jgi:hypothetical protein